MQSNDANFEVAVQNKVRYCSHT